MENGAVPHSAFHGDGAMHRVDNLLHEGQSHACANLRTIVFALIERLEDVRNTFWWYSPTRVAHVYQQSFALGMHLNVHRSRCWRVLKGVRQQVVHHLIHIVGHKVHAHFIAKVGREVDVLHAGIFAIALDGHGYLRHDVTVSPFGITHSRLHL